MPFSFRFLKPCFVGFIWSTSLTISEIQSFLVSGSLSPSDFDAYICNSCSDLYYPSLNPEDRPFVVDLYYHSHIEYGWGGEGLKKSLVRWADSITDKKGENGEQIVTPAEQLSTDYCYAFKVQKLGKELRKLLRIQALRCHPIYCQNGTRLNVIPVLASRSQALRYLFFRWGFELSKMVVFVGECGDTDYEGLVSGIHKSVILKGLGSSAIGQLHNNRSYPLSDVIPLDSPNTVEATEGSSCLLLFSSGCEPPCLASIQFSFVFSLAPLVRFNGILSIKKKTEGSSSADIQALIKKVGYLKGWKSFVFNYASSVKPTVN